MRFELDCWDVGAIIAILLVLVGLAVWHWPAALVATGSSFLWLYYHREVHLAPQPVTRSEPGNGPPRRDD